jgi:16S rRNA G966 N2-methylase RsmD
MRIIAGKYKGRKLFTPADLNVRPTSDRTRESLFNLLMHGSYAGEHIIDQPVADICAGTGALGLEALSRGAKSCIFVDNNDTALKLARKNAEHLGLLSEGTRGRPTGPTMERSGMRGGDNDPEGRWTLSEAKSPKGEYRQNDANQSQRGVALPRPPVRDSEPQKLLFLNADASKLPNAPNPCALILMDAPYNSPYLQKTLETLLQKNWLLPNALICLEQKKTESLIEIQGLTLLDERSYGKASLRIYRA